MGFQVHFTGEIDEKFELVVILVIIDLDLFHVDVHTGKPYEPTQNIVWKKRDIFHDTSNLHNSYYKGHQIWDL